MSSISSFPTSISNLGDLVEKTDDDQSLQVYSYKYCGNDSTNALKNCRGLVYNDDTLLFRSLGFTPEYTDSSQEISHLLYTPLDEYSFFPSEEGTLIRLFNYNNKWYVATHRKLNAYNSRWGSSKSFGEIFEDSVKLLGWTDVNHLTSNLDCKHMYLFFVRNILENKIVSNPPTDSLQSYFVGCILNGTGEFTFDCPHPLNFPKQVLLNFQNWNEVLNYVNSVNPQQKQGVLVFSKNKETGETTQLKIVNTKYQLYSQVRGNEPNVKLRYLQVRSHPIYSKLIYELYPEHINTFLSYENITIKIAKNIHNAYISRFVNKNYVVVSQEEYRVIQECHGWHISDRVNNKVTLSQVIRLLNQEKFVSTLYILVNRYLSNKTFS
jgi:hypothetical protein